MAPSKLPAANPLADTDAYRVFWNRGREGVRAQAREQPLPLPVRRLFDYFSRETTKKFSVDMRTNHEEHMERIHDSGVLLRQSLRLQETQNDQLEKLLAAIRQWRPGGGSGGGDDGDIDLGLAARGGRRVRPGARGRLMRRRFRGVVSRFRSPRPAVTPIQPPAAIRPAPVVPPQLQGRVPAGGGLVYDTRTNRFHDPAQKYRMIGREEAARRGASIPRPQPAPVTSPAPTAAPPPAAPLSRTQRAAGFAGRMLLPLTAAIAVWQAWTQIKALDVNMERDQYRRAVTVIVAQVVAQVGLVWVGAIFGAALAGLITGPGAIVGFIAGIGGGVLATIALGDSTDAIVEQLVLRLWRGPAPGESGQVPPLAPGSNQTYDKIVFEAGTITFDFGNMPATRMQPPPATIPQSRPPAGVTQAAYGGQSSQSTATGGGSGAPIAASRPPVLTPRQQAVIGDQSFDQALEAMANRLQIDKQAILAVMNAESSLNPAAVNPSTGATGLIQFMPATARGLGTTVEALRGMTAVQQLPYVEQFLRQSRVPPGASPGRIYASVFLPGRANREVLTERGEAYYEANRGLDMNGDGKITVEDLDARLQRSSRAILQARPAPGQALNTQGQAAAAAQVQPTPDTTIVVPIPAPPPPTPAVIQPDETQQEVQLNSRLRQLVA